MDGFKTLKARMYSCVVKMIGLRIEGLVVAVNILVIVSE
jgi:hypothetical protein